MLGIIRTATRPFKTENEIINGVIRIATRVFTTKPAQDRAARNWHHRGLDLTELHEEFEKNLSHCRAYW